MYNILSVTCWTILMDFFFKFVRPFPDHLVGEKTNTLVCKSNVYVDRHKYWDLNVLMFKSS